MTEIDGAMYVIVNTSNRDNWGQAFGDPLCFYVLPGDEPHTHGDLTRILEDFLDLQIEYNHTLETAPIFKLVPVPIEELEALYKDVRDEYISEIDTDLQPEHLAELQGLSLTEGL